MKADDTLCPWADVEVRDISARYQATYMALVGNLLHVPVFDNSSTPCEFFVESMNLRGLQMVWKFMFPSEHCTER